MDAHGTDLRLTKCSQIRYNTLCMQGAKGSIPFTSTKWDGLESAAG